jgi:hypothetical protein
MGQLAAIGVILQGISAIKQGQEEERASEVEAMQMEAKANEEAALSQRRAISARRRGDRAVSRAKAIAAASGGRVDDPTIQNITDDLEEDTDFNVLSALYEGESRGKDLGLQARETRRRGRYAKKSSYMNAAASTGKSLYSMYS